LAGRFVFLAMVFPLLEWVALQKSSLAQSPATAKYFWTLCRFQWLDRPAWDEQTAVVKPTSLFCHLNQTVQSL